MLDHYKWRRKQINNYFLPKTGNERKVVQQKCSAMLATKLVNTRASQQTLRELQNTILETATANPLEDLSRTQQILQQSHDQTGFSGGAAARTRAGGGVGQKQMALPVYTSHEDSRFGGTGTQMDTTKRSELTTTDVREARDLTLRQLLRIDDRIDTTTLSAHQAPPEPEEPPAPANMKLRGAASYRDRKPAY